MVPLGRFDRCWSIIQPTFEKSVAIREAFEVWILKLRESFVTLSRSEMGLASQQESG